MLKQITWFLVMGMLGIVLIACNAATHTPDPEAFGGGGKIAYRTKVDENTQQIRYYDVVTEKDHLVLSDETYKFWFSWSPDQKQILYQSDFHPPNSYIYKVDITGENQQPIVTDPTARNWMPDWSPDGQQIAFCSDRSGVFTLYVMKADGSNLKQITEIDSSAPRWSPDGQRIAFQAYVDDNYEIFVVNADGSNLVNLTKHPASDMIPSWSPDGNRLSFTSDRDSVEAKGDIFITNADGTYFVNLTQNPAEDNNATWSPDGNKLAFMSDREGSSQLHVIDINNLEVTKLPIAASQVSSPAWSK
jgi:TolB protein